MNESYIEILISFQYDFAPGMKRDPKWRVKGDKTNRLVEKWSKIIDFALMKVCVPSAVLPKVVVSYFTYFTTDAGSEAFDLPIPSW